MPAKWRNLLCDSQDDVRRRGLARDMRKKREADATHANVMHPAKFVSCDVFVDTDDTGCTPFHVFECIDDDAVVCAVARCLNDNKSPETHPVDEDFLLLLPCG